MNADEISRYAASGKMPDDLVSVEDRCLFYELKDIYSQYNSGKISKKIGEERKIAAVRQYDKDCFDAMSRRKLSAHYSSLWKEIESAGSLYMTDPTIEHADAFVEAVYRVKRKGERADGQGG